MTKIVQKQERHMELKITELKLEMRKKPNGDGPTTPITIRDTKKYDVKNVAIGGITG